MRHYSVGEETAARFFNQIAELEVLNDPNKQRGAKRRREEARHRRPEF